MYVPFNKRHWGAIEIILCDYTSAYKILNVFHLKKNAIECYDKKKVKTDILKRLSIHGLLSPWQNTGTYHKQ